MCRHSCVSGHHIVNHGRRVLAVMAVAGLFMTSCGTGIEVTEHVTDKDVRRVIGKTEKQESTVTLIPFKDPMSGWKTGKRFWVADDQVKQLLLYSGYDADTLHLSGHILCFDGWVSSDLYNAGSADVDIRFKDESTGQQLIYRYGKTVNDVHGEASLPMLIDMDKVEHVGRQVEGKDFFIRTPIWYDRSSGQMMAGNHFIKVHIDSVLPGNEVMPYRVLFTAADSHTRAMVWMSDPSSTMLGRDFDALFSASDPRLSYPEISDENWAFITRGQVVEGMSKIECQLSIGSAKQIREVPDQSGMREYWYYDGGSYLYFVDGLLRQYRR